MFSFLWKAVYIVAGWLIYNFLLILALEPLATFTLMFQKAEWFFGTFQCMLKQPIFVIVNVLYLGWVVTLIWAERRRRHLRTGGPSSAH